MIEVGADTRLQNHGVSNIRTVLYYDTLREHRTTARRRGSDLIGHENSVLYNL